MSDEPQLIRVLTEDNLESILVSKLCKEIIDAAGKLAYDYIKHGTNEGLDANKLVHSLTLHLCVNVVGNMCLNMADRDYGVFVAQTVATGIIDFCRQGQKLHNELNKDDE